MNFKIQKESFLTKFFKFSIICVMELSFKNLEKVRAILKGRQREIFNFQNFEVSSLRSY